MFTLYDVVNSSPSSRSREARTRMRPSCDVHLRGGGVPVKLTELANITHDGHVAPFRVGLARVGEEGEGGEEADQTGASADTVCLEPVHVNMVFHLSL